MIPENEATESGNGGMAMRFYLRLPRLGLVVLFACLVMRGYASVYGSEVLVTAIETQQKVTVVLRVKVPEAGSAGGEETKIFVAGNTDALGQWRPDGLQLQRIDALTYEGEFTADLGSEIEFKITQGMWEKVEQASNGADIPNRKLKLERSMPQEAITVEVCVESWKHEKVSRSTITGEVVYHRKTRSMFLKEERTVTVWLPPDYRANADRLPVLYLQDGQNVFDSATAAFGDEWGVDEALTKLIADNKVPAMIVVAIGNSRERLKEYTFTRDQRFGQGGEGESYLKFLIEELKPFIDQNYRTEKDAAGTWIGGSSLGGLFALYAAGKRSDVFGGCLAFSPSLHWDEEKLLRDTAERVLNWGSCKIWLSMGTAEGGTIESRKANVQRIEALAKAIREQNREIQLTLRRFEGEERFHNEKSWRAQFPVAIESLFSIGN